MASFNKVMLMGNLTRNPELKYTSNGLAVANFGLAVNRKSKQGDEWKDEVCFVEITVWGKQGENCEKYIDKGSPVFIEGFLKFSTWESDGQKRNKLEVVANTVQFLRGGPSDISPPDGPDKGPLPGGPPPNEIDDVPF